MSSKAKAIKAIPYGNKGIIPAKCAQFEKDMLEQIAENEINDYTRDLIEMHEAIDNRRDEEKKNEKHQLEFDEVKRYLTLKIRDKEQKYKFYQNKLKETRKEREDLITKLQAEQDQLKQSHELELTQLSNALKANKQRKDALATVAAMEIQLKREIEEAEQTLKREKAQQSQQTSQALAEFYMLHVRQQKELKDGVEREKAKNRGMTSENLERTVIEMMKDIDSEIKKYSAMVMESREITDVNSKLMKLTKQKYMERDLLQQESDSTIKKINKNDQMIRKLVEELRKYDQKLAGGIIEEEPEGIKSEEEVRSSETIEKVRSSEKVENSENPETTEKVEDDSEKVDTTSEKVESSEKVEDVSEKVPVDRESVLNSFFEKSVDVLCASVVEILGVFDQQHADEYRAFHSVFDSFEGRKKELRFLMSKLGNLTFEIDESYMFPPAGLDEVEGADEEVTARKIIEPQRKAIEEFAEPIADDELPDLISTQFFQ